MAKVARSESTGKSKVAATSKSAQEAAAAAADEDSKRLWSEYKETRSADAR